MTSEQLQRGRGLAVLFVIAAPVTDVGLSLFGYWDLGQGIFGIFMFLAWCKADTTSRGFEKLWEKSK